MPPRKRDWSERLALTCYLQPQRPDSPSCNCPNLVEAPEPGSARLAYLLGWAILHLCGKCISPASVEPPCRSFPTGVSAGRTPWQGAWHPRRVFHRTSEKGLPSLPGRFLWAKCAERNRYLPRHHFPRAWRLCPPNLAGEPPFAAPRGRSLDIPYYGAKPTPCQVGTEQARINLDAQKTDYVQSQLPPSQSSH